MVKKYIVILFNVMEVKFGENNLIFIVVRFDLGYWEIWINYIYFIVVIYS